MVNIKVILQFMSRVLTSLKDMLEEVIVMSVSNQHLPWGRLATQVCLVLL